MEFVTPRGTTKVTVPETVIYKVEGRVFIHGYLILDMPPKGLEPISPTTEEVQRFNGNLCQALDDARLHRVSSRITKGWTVRIRNHAMAGVRGVVIADRGSLLDIMVLHQGGSLQADKFTRDMVISDPTSGSSVDVAVGEWAGKRGLVQQIDEDGNLEVLMLDSRTQVPLEVTPAGPDPRMAHHYAETLPVLTICPLDVDQVTFSSVERVHPTASQPTADGSGTGWTAINQPAVLPALTTEELTLGNKPKLTTGAHTRHPLYGKDVIIQANPFSQHEPTPFDKYARLHKGQMGSLHSMTPGLIATVHLHGVHDKPPIQIPVWFLDEAPHGAAQKSSKYVQVMAQRDIDSVECPKTREEFVESTNWIPSSEEEMARFKYVLPPIDEEPMGYFRRKVLDSKHAMFMVGTASISLGSVSEGGLLQSGIVVKVEGSDKYGVQPHFMEGSVRTTLRYDKDRDVFKISFPRCISSGHKSWTNPWISGDQCWSFDIPGIFIHPIKPEKGMFVGLESSPMVHKGYIYRHNGKFTPLLQKHSKSKQVMPGGGYRYDTVDEMEGIWFVRVDNINTH